MAVVRSAVGAFTEHCEWTGASADDDRSEWLRTRRLGVGGSDAAAILGVDDYKSALAIYAEKIATSPPDEQSSEVAEWGRIFEPAIIKEYARRSGRRVVHGGRLLRSKRAAHHLITLDGVQLTKAPTWARGPGVAEVKTTGYGQRYDDDLPVEVQVQIQWEMFVTGATWATCVWLPFPERRLQWLDVAPHPDFQAMLAERVDAFWLRVQRREPPDPDGSESSMQALRRLYPGQTEEVIRISGATGVADEYERNRAAIKLLQERQSLIKNTLAATIQDAKYALLEDGRYWGTAFYKPRENRCRHCTEVLSTTDAYRTYQLRDARKKPFPMISATRRLVIDLVGDGDPLTKQLSESLVGAGVPQNDQIPSAVGGEGGAQ